ncbi:MAG: VanZ family protein [Acidobacteriota bacterium]|nr:VanZ family protein [Acidobacteriota bacterium]
MTLSWAGLIFYLSTGTYSASFTGAVLERLLAAFGIHLSPSHFDTLNFYVRKSAHFTEYAILCLLLWASISAATDFQWDLRTAALSVLIAGLYSFSDEFHQLFVPGRTSSIRDCGIDTAGAAFAMLLVYVYSRRKPIQSSSISA